MDYTPLDPSTLGEQAQRALAPGPMRLMAARGLVPITKPGELVSVLYQLAQDSDPQVAAAAGKSAQDLPDRVLGGALGDPSLDPRVLDYFAKLALPGRPALLQPVILNHATADETITRLAAVVGAAECDLIAQNEQRLLRCPGIIAAMYHNPKARMSTVDRMVELAVRNQIQIPEIAAWDVLVGAILGNVRDPNAGHSAEETDAIFAQAAEASERAARERGADSSPPADAESDDSDDAGEAQTSQTVDEDDPRDAPIKKPIAQMTIPQKIRLATLGNSFARAMLIRDPNRMVSGAAIRSPGVTDVEAAKYAGNQAINDDVIKYIAGRRDWTKGYSVKLSLVQNPKTPIADTMRFIPHLRERDLRNLARSKGVPSAVVAQARKLLASRSQGGQNKGNSK